MNQEMRPRLGPRKETCQLLLAQVQTRHSFLKMSEVLHPLTFLSFIITGLRLIQDRVHRRHTSPSFSFILHTSSPLRDLLPCQGHQALQPCAVVGYNGHDPPIQLFGAEIWGSGWFSPQKGDAKRLI